MGVKSTVIIGNHLKQGRERTLGKRQKKKKEKKESTIRHENDK